MKTTRIQPRFKIPKGYSRKFVINCGGIKHWMEFSHKHGIRYANDDPTGIGNISHCLDWLFDSLATAKSECGRITGESA